MTKSQKSTFLATLIILIVIGAVYFYILHKPQSLTPNNIIKNTEIQNFDLTLQPDFFTSQSLGFKIKLPSKWSLDQEDENGAIFYSDVFASDADLIITKEKLGMYTLENYVQNTKDQISKYQGVRTETITIEKVSIDSQLVYILRWTLPKYKELDYEYEARDYIEYIQAKGNTVYNISTDVSQAYSAQYKNVLESSLKTFTIL